MMMEMTEIQAEIFEEAKSVLETLLSLMDMPSSVGISEEFTVVGEEGEASSVGLNIEGEDMGILIGRRGQTLATLQYMVRLIVGHKMQTRMPIVVDVESYKWRRCEKLQALAWRIAEQVRVKKISFSLEPMSPFERRIIHLALADHPDVFTESTGFGEARKVVVKLKLGYSD